MATGFADWKLVVDGLVERPLSLSLTRCVRWSPAPKSPRHDCVEGWSSIGQWGAKLSAILERAGLKPDAKHIVFHCADSWTPSAPDGDYYYECRDLVDAFTPRPSSPTR